MKKKLFTVREFDFLTQIVGNRSFGLRILRGILHYQREYHTVIKDLDLTQFVLTMFLFAEIGLDDRPGEPGAVLQALWEKFQNPRKKPVDLLRGFG